MRPQSECRALSPRAPCRLTCGARGGWRPPAIFGRLACERTVQKRCRQDSGKFLKLNIYLFSKNARLLSAFTARLIRVWASLNVVLRHPTRGGYAEPMAAHFWPRRRRCERASGGRAPALAICAHCGRSAVNVLAFIRLAFFSLGLVFCASHSA